MTLSILGASQVAANLAKVLEVVRRKTIPGVVISSGDLDACLTTHFREVRAWMNEIRVDPLAPPRTITDIFVDLDLGMTHQAPSPKERPLCISDLAGVDDSIVILGAPGAGKTTALRRLAQFAVEDALSVGRVPILLQARNLGKDESFSLALCGLFQITVSVTLENMSPEERDLVAHRARIETLASLLASFPALILFDGIDEYRGSVRGLARDVEEIMHLEEPRQGRPTRWILTCRTESYVVTFPRVAPYELMGLTRGQVDRVARAWLPDDDRRVAFLTDLGKTRYADAAIRPLVLAVLLLIYLRSGGIPDKPRSVYQRIIRLFVEDWDAGRGVQRISRYAGFTIERKVEFLEALAFELMRMGRRGSFSYGDLLSAYSSLAERFALPETEAEQVCREVASHTGLVMQRSWEYQFFHLTIQEHLAASYLVRRAGHQELSFGFEENPEVFAVLTALSSAPTHIFATLAEEYRRYRMPPNHSAPDAVALPFVSRLVFERPDWEVTSLLGAAFASFYTTFTDRDPFGVGLEASVWVALGTDGRVLSGLERFVRGFVERVAFRNGAATLTLREQPFEPVGNTRAFVGRNPHPFRVPRAVYDKLERVPPGMEET